MVRPHLEYCNQIWGPFNVADTKLVERVQRRATRLVPELRRLPYDLPDCIESGCKLFADDTKVYVGAEVEERLKKLHLPNLQYRRRRGHLVTMFNIMHGRSGLDKDDLFSPAPSTRTRGHRLKVAKKPAISRVRRNHFATRVVSNWNALPEDIVCSPSVNALKNRLDKHWKEYAFIAP